ncbi:hypothetical protein SAMD00019534_003300 [Acytostelium subglobosum LB1]|uniref:hypothetical protein n=1 Tax=Acytostelium subglobosum LB1 TaxID=1410327 RepID=UPI000644E1C2|nr:hypothetical protein SAMD00019534_003300 [Acytostelium subglobosum LB1]GAM17155.1 hypothetical protein SAMD00019534_003300 [Acytostelium subglobosum LB1]|eukprot:XP_012759217.1 hypothetical protein SAMD00019534_003300 [Acytostelium subglobosum LB1]
MTSTPSNGNHSSSSSSNVFVEGTAVWVPDAQLEWVAADVMSVSENELSVMVRIRDDDRELSFHRDKVFLQNPEILEGIDDLAGLSHLHEAAILHNLHHRYNINTIYTYIGKILIAINPYTSLPLYGREMISAYYGKQLGALEPHVYAVAEDAFKDMRYDGSSQSILVSGESGAGKTETTKFLLQYFAAMGNMIKTSGSASNLADTLRKSTTDKSIEERVLESTPLLEAFGNAKTLRNDNSSRFGKFIEIHFNDSGSIIGAKILTYLLEKSRLVRQVFNERNYHIFYQLLVGASDEMRERLFLGSPQDYHYLNQSQCFEIEGVDDDATFLKTCHAMSVAGISMQEQENVFKIISIVLHLGNIEFVDQGDDSSSIGQDEPLEKAATLIGCPKEELAKTFLTRKVVTGKESFVATNTKERAENARDSLAMLLYGLMFEWLVVKINSSMSVQQKSKSFIGILDIYGFESFEVNGFEQFCINYANEKLQQVFNQHVFKEEQQEYIKEKIDWSYIDFNDNQDTLDLIEKRPMCILSLLDEESMFPKATPQTFATKLYSKLASHVKFEKPRFSHTAFTVQHYAGKVTYETDQFLDKNKDFIIPEQIAVLQKASFAFIKTVLGGSERLGAGGPQPSNKQASASASSSMKFSSVGSQFSASLATLMKTIGTTTPHYIRCIKPNPDKQPQNFNKHDVIHQLRCGGVMESVRICCAGFPTRRPLGEFYARYKLLYTKSQTKRGAAKDPRTQVQTMLEGIQLSDDKYKLGISKVFLRAGQLAALENQRMGKLNHSATVIQSFWRGYHCRKQYRLQRSAALVIQTRIRAQMAKNKMQFMRRINAATLIQKVFRGYRCRNAYKKRLNSAKLLQCAIRKSVAKSVMQVEMFEHAAIQLQTVIRAATAKKKLKSNIRGIILIQAKWRGKMARKLYSEMRAEARSLRSVQDAKNKLQEKLEEIQWRLTAEQRGKQHLEETKQRLEVKLDEATDAKDRLEMQVSDLQHRATKFEAGNKALEAEVATLGTNLQEKTQQLEQMTSDKKRLDVERSELLTRTQNNQVQIEQMSSELKQEHEDNARLSEELRVHKAETSDRIKSLESQLAAKSHELEVYAQELTSTKKKLDRVEENNLTLNSLKDTLQSSFNQLVEENGDIKEQVAKSNETNVRLETASKMLETELARLKELSDRLERQLDETTKKYQQEQMQWKMTEESTKLQIISLNSNAEDLKSKLQQKDTQMGEMSEKFKKIKNKLESVQEDKKATTGDYDKVKAIKQALEEEKNQLNQQITIIKQEKDQSVSNNQQLKEKLSNTKSTLESTLNEASRLRNDIAAKDEQVSRMNTELQELRVTSLRQAKELVDVSSTLQIEKTKGEIAITQNERQIDSLKADGDRLQQQLKQSERDLSNARETTGRLELEIKQLNNLKERFESEFFVAKEKSTTTAQESLYLKEVTSQMQQSQDRLEKESLERKQMVERLEDEKDLLKKQVEKLTIQGDQTALQLQTTQMQMEAATKKRHENKEKVTKLSAQLEQLNTDLAQLKNNNATLQSSLAEADMERKKLKDKSSKTKQQYQELRETSVKQETELTMTKSKMEWVENSYGELKQRNQDLSELYQMAKSQHGGQATEWERIKEAKDEELQQLRSQVQVLKDGQASQENVQKERSGELESKLLSMQEEILRMSTANKQLEEQSSSLTSQLQEQRVENQGLKQQAFEYKKNNRKSIEVQQFLEDTKSNQLNEIQTLKNTIEELRLQQAASSEWQMERERMAKQIEQLMRERQQTDMSRQQMATRFSEASFRLGSLGRLEEIMDRKENDWEKLARSVGNQEKQTRLLSDYLLSCKLEHSTLAGQMWFHQITYWQAFEIESSKIFKGIIMSIASFSHTHFEDIDLTSYLLASSSLLLYVFQSKLPKGSVAITASIPTMAELEDIETSLDTMPSMAGNQFIIHLQQSIGRSYGLLFSIVTTRLQSIIDSVILNENYNKKTAANGASSNLNSIEMLTNYLQSVIGVFQPRMIHFELSQQFFNQVFSWMSAVILNAFFLRSVFCTEPFANHTKARIDTLLRWANETGDVWVGNVDKSFDMIKEVIAVLTIKDKEKLAEEKVRKQTCPSLNPYQLRQVLAHYNPGENGFGKKVTAKTITLICPPSRPSAPYVVDEKKLNYIPIKSLHYYEDQDIKHISLPGSIKFSIENEIKTIIAQCNQEQQQRQQLQLQQQQQQQQQQ